MGNWSAAGSKPTTKSGTWNSSWVPDKIEEYRNAAFKGIGDAAVQEAERIRKRKGTSSTIITGISGINEPAMVLRQTLGGE